MTVFQIVTFAPFTISNFAISLFPYLEAQMSAVFPYVSFALTSAPFSISNLATSICPYLKAQMSGASPYVLNALTSAPF